MSACLHAFIHLMSPCLHARRKKKQAINYQLGIMLKPHFILITHFGHAQNNAKCHYCEYVLLIAFTFNVYKRHTKQCEMSLLRICPFNRHDFNVYKETNQYKPFLEILLQNQPNPHTPNNRSNLIPLSSSHGCCALLPWVKFDSDSREHPIRFKTDSTTWMIIVVAFVVVLLLFLWGAPP